MEVHFSRRIYTPCVNFPISALPSILYLVARSASIITQVTDWEITIQYQYALHRIESGRKDGKFVGVDGSIPEGQGILMAHLNECHELLEIVSATSLLAFAISLPLHFVHLSTPIDFGGFLPCLRAGIVMFWLVRLSATMLPRRFMTSFTPCMVSLSPCSR